jgi:hypothetical protein
VIDQERAEAEYGGSMPSHRISVAAEVNAPAGPTYAVIADYRDGHPRIIPRPPFVSLDVEQGGIGAGTVIRCGMRVLGRTRTFRAAITEPEPGRRLVETEFDTGLVTTFDVEPLDAGRTRVTITTDMNTRGGLLGRLERSLITGLLRPVYRRELGLLGAVAAERAAGQGRS